MELREVLDTVSEQRWDDTTELLEENVELNYTADAGLTPPMMALLHKREDIVSLYP